MSPDRVTDLVPSVHVRSGRGLGRVRRHLGFEVNSTFEPDGELAWAFLQRAHARIMLARADAPIDPERQGVLFWLYTQDLDGFHARLRAAGSSRARSSTGRPARRARSGSPTPTATG